MEKTQRRVRFNQFVDYIQKEYRKRVLNSKDFELMKNIADSYSAEEIKLALDYCKEKRTDSLVYLQDALSQKYYQNEQKKEIVPNWIKHPEMCKEEPMTEEEQKELEDILKKYK